jgi:hypothetical protein
MERQSQNKKTFGSQSVADKLSCKTCGGIVQQKHKTGLEDGLKSGIENLSGYSMDDVKVNYNSVKPAQMQAHAFAQGTNIHLASGQEKHLPHEAWHVVQQKQGKVRPTTMLKGVAINNNAGLEKEADQMGKKAAQLTSIKSNGGSSSSSILGTQVIQRFEWRKNLGRVAGVAGYAIGGVLGGVKGLGTRSLEGVMKGAKEGADEGYYRPGAAVGTLVGGTLGQMAGGIGGAVAGAVAGNYIGKKINDRITPTAYWKLVDDGRKRYKRIKDQRGPKALSQNVQAARDLFFQQQYKTFPTGTIFTSTGAVSRRGGDEANIQSDFRHNVPPQDQSKDGRYSSQYPLERGMIIADQNYSVEQPGPERYLNPDTNKNENFSNSEILFQQWRLAKQNAYPGEQLPDLQTLRRAHVAGTEGKKAIQAIRAENGLTDRHERTFRKGSDNYFALLGLPNSIAALWLILDHGDEMNIHDIPSITLKSGNSIELNFR